MGLHCPFIPESQNLHQGPLCALLMAGRLGESVLSDSRGARHMGPALLRVWLREKWYPEDSIPALSPLELGCDFGPLPPSCPPHTHTYLAVAFGRAHCNQRGC